MNYPPFLKSGATFRIVCPSGYMAYEKIKPAIAMLQDMGYRIKEGITLHVDSRDYFSAPDAIRLADLQQALDDPDTDAILMGRGGYGMSRMLDELDLTGFLKRPKWICGFSDITALHSHLYAHTGMASLHSPMCAALGKDQQEEAHVRYFIEALSGRVNDCRVPASVYHRYGVAEGTLVGGNLSLLTHLMDTVSEVDLQGKILFIEDVGEYLYHIDRMLLQWKRSGRLSQLSGMIVGGFTGIKDTERPFGQTLEWVIQEKVQAYGYPVCFHFPAGHQEQNYTLVLGGLYRLQVDEKGALLKFLYKQ